MCWQLKCTRLIFQVLTGASIVRSWQEVLEPPWGAQTALKPGINRVTIEEKNAAGEHLRYNFYDIWYDDGSVATKGGTAVTETWTASRRTVFD